MSEPADPAVAAVAPPPETRPPKIRTRPASSLLEPSILRRAVREAFLKLDPRNMIRVPVMFVVEIGSVITAVQFFARPDLFVGLITLWLWATVLFANFAEAVAEGRGKAQADTLRRSRQETSAILLRPDGDVEEIPSTRLKVGDLCVVTAGQVIPGDGDVVEGMATVDESAVTGESAPVIRESGGDRCAVTGGTTVLSDRIVVRVTSNPGETFLDRMIALVEGASRQKTPNEVALDILIAGLTMILLVAVVTLQPMAIYSHAIQSTAVLVALFVCLAPTTIGGLLSAIGIAGMDRMVQRNVLAMSGRAVEAAGDCSTLLLDKTGTITYGNRMAAEFLPAGGAAETELAAAVLLSSLADETPEGRSIVEFAETHYGLTPSDLTGGELVPFSAQTRMSGIDLAGRQIRKGAADSVRRWVLELGGEVPADLAPNVERIAAGGGTPLVVADGPRVLGVIHLKDTGPPRGEVPAARRRRHPPAEQPHLRRRRDHRPVRLHQAHRSRADRDRVPLTCDATFSPASSCFWAPRSCSGSGTRSSSPASRFSCSGTRRTAPFCTAVASSPDRHCLARALPTARARRFPGTSSRARRPPDPAITRRRRPPPTSARRTRCSSGSSRASTRWGWTAARRRRTRSRPGQTRRACQPTRRGTP